MDKTSQGKAPTVTNDKGEMDMSAIYDFVVQETRQQIEASQVVALQRLNVSMITITQDATLQKLMDATQRNIANTPQPTIQRKPQSGTPTDTKRRYMPIVLLVEWKPSPAVYGSLFIYL